MWNFAEVVEYDYGTYDYTYTTSASGNIADGSAMAAFAAMMGVFFIPIIIVAVVSIIALWKMFDKAGKPGWAAIIPIYNMWVLAEMAGKPGWWALLVLVPFVGPLIWFILSLIIAMDLAKAFGKDSTFGVIALWLFSIVGYLILAFGSAKYKAPAGAK